MVGVGGSWGSFKAVLGVLGKADFKDAGCWLEPFRVQVGYADGWCWGVLGGLLEGLSGCRLVTLMVGVGGCWGVFWGVWGGVLDWLKLISRMLARAFQGAGWLR